MSSEPSPAPSHPRARRIGGLLIAVLVAFGGVILLLLFFQGRDHSQLSGSRATVAGPGHAYPDRGHAHLQAGERPRVRYASDPPTSGPHVPVAIRADATLLSDDQILHALELGDVVLLYGSARPPAALRALARELAGPFDPALANVGQAVVLGRRPGTTGVVALAWRHLLRAASAEDPAIESFAAFWLGRGAQG
ncbi:MAG: DUF3105 domain-containing protein [Conexibacter sp.]